MSASSPLNNSDASFMFESDASNLNSSVYDSNYDSELEDEEWPDDGAGLSKAAKVMIVVAVVAAVVGILLMSGESASKGDEAFLAGGNDGQAYEFSSAEDGGNPTQDTPADGTEDSGPPSSLPSTSGSGSNSYRSAYSSGSSSGYAYPRNYNTNNYAQTACSRLSGQARTDCLADRDRDNDLRAGDSTGPRLAAFFSKRMLWGLTMSKNSYPGFTVANLVSSGGSNIVGGFPDPADSTVWFLLSSSGGLNARTGVLHRIGAKSDAPTAQDMSEGTENDEELDGGDCSAVASCTACRGSTCKCTSDSACACIVGGTPPDCEPTPPTTETDNDDIGCDDPRRQDGLSKAGGCAIPLSATITAGAAGLPGLFVGGTSSKIQLVSPAKKAENGDNWPLGIFECFDIGFGDVQSMAVEGLSSRDNRDERLWVTGKNGVTNMLIYVKYESNLVKYDEGCATEGQCLSCDTGEFSISSSLALTFDDANYDYAQHKYLLSCWPTAVSGGCYLMYPDGVYKAKTQTFGSAINDPRENQIALIKPWLRKLSGFSVDPAGEGKAGYLGIGELRASAFFTKDESNTPVDDFYVLFGSALEPYESETETGFRNFDADKSKALTAAALFPIKHAEGSNLGDIDQLAGFAILMPNSFSAGTLVVIGAAIVGASSAGSAYESRRRRKKVEEMKANKRKVTNGKIADEEAGKPGDPAAAAGEATATAAVAGAGLGVGLAGRKAKRSTKSNGETGSVGSAGKASISKGSRGSRASKKKTKTASDEAPTDAAAAPAEVSADEAAALAMYSGSSAVTAASSGQSDAGAGTDGTRKKKKKRRGSTAPSSGSRGSGAGSSAGRKRAASTGSRASRTSKGSNGSRAGKSGGGRKKRGSVANGKH